MKMKNLFAVLGLATAVVLASSCGGGNKKAEEEAARKKREADSLAQIQQAQQDSLAKLNEVPALVNVVETAKSNADLSTLVELIGAAGLAETLSNGTANFTVFAPTNDAFSKVKNLDALKNDLKKRQELTDLLTYHVVSGKFGSADLKEGAELDALDEKVIKIASKDGGLTVGGAKIVTADIQASNGVIHIVDVVMTPPTKKSKSKNPVTTTTTTTTTTTSTTKPGEVGGKQTGTQTQEVGGKQTGTETQKVGGKQK